MIDIHHHCLPGVDDGPRTLDEAAEMCAMAAAEGIKTIIATPHVLRGLWKTLPRLELDNCLASLRERTNDEPRLILGSEYFFAHDMTEVLQAGTSIIPLAASRYILMELAASTLPPMFEQPIYRAQLAGWVPILAHPERNVRLQDRPEMLVSLVRLGLRTQITAGSLTGEFGPKARAAAETFLKAGVVHFLATDAHNTTRRPPRVSQAIRRLRELAGDEVAEHLTVHNPAAVVENRELPWQPEPSEETSGGFFSRMRRLFDAH